MSRVRIAAAQYDIGFFSHWQEYEAKLERWVAEAAGQGADLLLFPEYASMEIASLLPESARADLAGQLHGLQAYLQRFIALHAALARRHRLYLLAASFPVAVGERNYRNRAHLFAPDGQHGYQDKLQMTRFEAERWLISPGEAMVLFETALGRLGVAICYDAEFPLLSRNLVEAGAEILLVPSCTDTLAGYHRVRIGAQARALENQCYVLQSPTVGEAPWSEAVDRNIGAAGVFSAPDRGLPDDGVLALGPMNVPAWVYANLDLKRIARVRRVGQVLNHRDWPRQGRWANVPVAQQTL